MPDCECLELCPFFKDFCENMPAYSESIKNQYCRGDNTNCARYLVFQKLGRPAIPKYLLPDEVDEAKRIIQEAR